MAGGHVIKDSAEFSAAHDRIAALADISRAASLEDLRLEVAVAHTKQRLRARFCVTLHRGRRHSWAFGVEIQEAKQFRSQLRHLTKTHKVSKCHAECAMCVQLRHELEQWPKFPAFSTIGKRHMDAKCAMLAQFFARVFRVLARNAPWLQSCEALREMLRMTETLCGLQYEHDSSTVSVIESLKRVTPVIGGPPPMLEETNQDDEMSCSICLSSLYEPAEASIADAAEAEPSTTSASNSSTTSMLQPTQGVELPCGHRFHDSCICLWFHTRLDCPVCRQDPQCDELFK